MLTSQNGLSQLLQWVLVLVMATASSLALSSLSEPDDGPSQIHPAWQYGDLHDNPYFQQLLLQDLEQNELEKRVPSSSTFMGMRGKKGPSGFFGMRGKKDDGAFADDEWSDEYDMMDKRGPVAGFLGMRGKKRPGSSGFFGVRGKKGPSHTNFFGVRVNEDGKCPKKEFDKEQSKKNDVGSEDPESLFWTLLLRYPQLWSDDERSMDGVQVQKKAPSGFFGMRGKKSNVGGWPTLATGSPLLVDTDGRQSTN